MIPIYKIEHIQGKDFTSKWGVVNFEELTFHVQTVMNEYASKGYRLHNQSTFLDTMGRINYSLTFEYKEDTII